MDRDLLSPGADGDSWCSVLRFDALSACALLSVALIVASAGCASSGAVGSDDSIDSMDPMGSLGSLEASERKDRKRRAARITGTGSAAPAVQARDYAPLAVGASWTYRTNILGDTSKKRVIIRIRDKVKGYYLDTAGGEYRHTSKGLRDRVRYRIRNPLRPGNKWKATLSDAAVEHYSIVSVGQPCEMPAGSFPDCLVVTAFQRLGKGKIQHVTYTWVRSVGLAKILVEGQLEGQNRFKQTELSLISYSLSAGAKDEEGAPTEWNR